MFISDSKRSERHNEISRGQLALRPASRANRHAVAGYGDRGRCVKLGLLGQIVGTTIEAGFRIANQGFSVEYGGGKPTWQLLQPLPLAGPELRLGIGSGVAARDQHETLPAEFAALRELGGDAPGMDHGSVPAGMLAAGPVRRETVFVDDVEEVAHVTDLCRSLAGFQ